MGVEGLKKPPPERVKIMYEDIRDRARQAAEQLVAAAKLKKMKYHKDYKKPEHGWADLRLAAAETGSRSRTANAMGKALLNIYNEAVR